MNNFFRNKYKPNTFDCLSQQRKYERLNKNLTLKLYTQVIILQSPSKGKWGKWNSKLICINNTYW